MPETIDPPAEYPDPEAPHMEQINLVEAPWESKEESPVDAAIDYLRAHPDDLKLVPGSLDFAHEKLSFSDPRDEGEGLRLGQLKQLFDSSTIIFNQTFLNVPVWQAAITLTLKHSPNRVIMVTDTRAIGMDAPLPPPERIEAHRTVFALAAAHDKLLALGLEDKGAAVGVTAEDQQSATAGFLRNMLGRAGGEEHVADDANAIRGRFFVYRYREAARSPAAPQAIPEGEEEAPVRSLPCLDLPPVSAAVSDGAWRLVSEITFSLTTAQYGPLNWRALVDVETDSVLLLEPLVSGLNGMVFLRDPITATGDGTLTAAKSNAVLNPHRTSVPLPNLDAPVAGAQALRGRFVEIRDVNPPNVAPPTRAAGAAFDFDARTDNFAAVNAYYHSDRFFAVVESLGFPIEAYFDGTTFPVPIDHRDFVGQGADTINAWCVGNGRGGIGFAGYALNDLTNVAAPIGRACDSRVHFHELGGHGILYEHVGTANFRFAHSAGDSLSAIYHDPESSAPDRRRYAPWNGSNTRRFDRKVEDGWAWGGINDRRLGEDGGYGSEQILCTTMFRIYHSIGGGSDDLERRKFASRMTMYLILRAIGTLTPATNPQNALNFANALMAVDLLDWTSERLSGGAYNKVIRWSFEKQGLYQPPGTPRPIATAGLPPEVDVYIDDGRGGEYQYQPVYWENPSIWNRRAADAGTTHQAPLPGVTNFAYARVKNRGTKPALNVAVSAFQRRPGGGSDWPLDFQPLATASLPAAGAIAPGGAQAVTVGPFPWVPNPDAARQDSLMMAASADGDASNLKNFTAGETIAEWRLVPHDNNIGLRRFAVAAAPSVPAPPPPAVPPPPPPPAASGAPAAPRRSLLAFLLSLFGRR